MDVFLIFKKEGEGNKASYVIETTTDEEIAMISLQGHHMLNDKVLTTYWCEQWTLRTPHSKSFRKYTHVYENGGIQTYS